MSNPTGGSVQLCALRVAKLNLDGSPHYAAANLYVTDRQISLSAEPEVSEGEDIELKNGCGAIIVDYRGPDAYRRLNVELTLAVPDPQLTYLLTQSGKLLTLTGATVGYDYPELFKPFPEVGVSIEAWSKNIVDGVVDGDNPYIRWVMPRVKNWRLGSRELADGAMETVLSGHGYGNALWGNGPLDDWDDLTAEDVDGPFAYALDATMPEPTNLAAALVDPDA